MEKGTVKQADDTPAQILTEPSVVPAKTRPSEGYVDFYGYHALAEGWCLAGWLPLPDEVTEASCRATLCFADEKLEGEVLSLCFQRDDILSHNALGLLIFLPAPPSEPGSLLMLQLEVAGLTYRLEPVKDARLTREDELVERLDFILSAAGRGSRQAAMDFRLNGKREYRSHGYIEYFGYSHNAGGWFFSGWVSQQCNETQMPERLLISYETGDVHTSAMSVFYRRADLPDGAGGILLFVAEQAGMSAPPLRLSLRSGDFNFRLQALGHLPQLREMELNQRLKSNLAQAKPGLLRDRMVNVMTRQPYSGEDTLDRLKPELFLYIDRAYICGPTGLLLTGWMLSKPDEIRKIQLRCGEQVVALSPANFIKINRQDVIENFASQGFEDPWCGFMMYVADIVRPGGKLHFEVETSKCELAYRNLPDLLPDGVSSIRQILDVLDVRFADLPPAFERVVGPAIAAMNQSRLARHVEHQVVEYGIVPAVPRYSVLVPLYGRLDFIEYQMALFSSEKKNFDVEYVFVLDDPPKQREALHLFKSVYERFRIPFRAVLLQQNQGFAPANNAGARYCHGEYLVYLNSDVFPGTSDWLSRLSARLEEDPTLGVVGPMLLFEDGAVQHRGMYFERLEEFGNWWFCQHIGKGLRYTGPGGMAYYIAVTGACMMLKRELAEQLGGFDNKYIIGDFEDSDLCLRIQEAGLRCGVDHDVILYHLERKSQLSGSLNWRTNLTVYNAWQHEKRWSNVIAYKQSHDFKARH